MLDDGRVFYAMKLVQGKRLDEFAIGVSSLFDLLRIFQKVCEAVAFAHARGVIHRDLKPENIMVGPFGEVLVMDWGVAKVLEDGEGCASATDRWFEGRAIRDADLLRRPPCRSPSRDPSCESDLNSFHMSPEQASAS